MLSFCIKNNVRTILRDPTTALAALIACIMQYMYGFNYSYLNQYDVDSSAFATPHFNYVMNVMLNAVATPVGTIAFVFLGIVIAVNLFKEKRTQTWDVTVTTQLSFSVFFCAKLISYYLIGLVMSAVLGLSFEICFFLKEGIFFRPLDLDPWRVLLSQMLWMFALYTSCLPVPIAVGVFFASLFGHPVMSVVGNCTYYYLPYLLPSSFLSGPADYIQVIPMKFWIFFKYCVIHPYDWYRVTIGASWLAELGVYSTFSETLISYVSLIGISAVLLAASYFLLKRHYDKA